MKASLPGPDGLNRAVIAFGSNLGDRVANIEAALSRMREPNLRIIKLSALYETKPMYYDDQDPFLNGVCQVETTLEPLPLLDMLQSIENELGRKRTIEKGPRTIDLDIVLYNQDYIKHPRLHIPHISMLERDFVLRPLAEYVKPKLPVSELTCSGFYPTSIYRQTSLRTVRIGQ
ncbi:2-amino-4-hydroxy-6-hydroxymethyldihydropteridine pyrophosphokinase [Cladophialophora carrionii]|uniref:2-amino-4-hydroxy-6-hydroxymethyldihydropteridine diphosphokinase n=1 Tax=Cladophialophora carrionii TaxID=86049 RepID=A0A1C1CRC6_9EURO|nr:2-amino-4-hydroxy-6-hydroxymethyldihydropteridine pyrophosphokinase [Cladophialophora carrionii]